MYAAFESEQKLSQKHLLEAVMETVPLSRTMEEDIENLRKWAEGRARRAMPVFEEPEQTSSVRNIEL